MPARRSMTLEFTYLVYATLDLVGFPLDGVEISQPTNVISVTTIIPSQNLR